MVTEAPESPTTTAPPNAMPPGMTEMSDDDAIAKATQEVESRAGTGEPDLVDQAVRSLPKPDAAPDDPEFNARVRQEVERMADEAARQDAPARRTAPAADPISNLAVLDAATDLLSEANAEDPVTQEELKKELRSPEMRARILARARENDAEKRNRMATEAVPRMLQQLGNEVREIREVVMNPGGPPPDYAWNPQDAYKAELMAKAVFTSHGLSDVNLQEPNMRAAIFDGVAPPTNPQDEARITQQITANVQKVLTRRNQPQQQPPQQQQVADSVPAFPTTPVGTGAGMDYDSMDLVSLADYIGSPAGARDGAAMRALLSKGRDR